MKKCEGHLIDGNPCGRNATDNGLCEYHSVAAELKYHPSQWNYTVSLSQIASHKQQNKVDVIMSDHRFQVARQRTVRAFHAVKAFHGDDFTIRKTAHGEIRFILLVWQNDWDPQKANKVAETGRRKQESKNSEGKQLPLF